MWGNARLYIYSSPEWITAGEWILAEVEVRRGRSSLEWILAGDQY
jgi:hypothetical protein